MRIKNLHRGYGSATWLARFDAQVTPDICLCGLKLQRQGEELRVYAAQHAGLATAHLAPELSRRIAEAAAAALAEVNAR